MKKKLILASLIGLMLTFVMGSTAMATHNPEETHHHHIHLPNGKCLAITSVHEGMKHADDSSAAVEFNHAYQHSC